MPKHANINSQYASQLVGIPKETIFRIERAFLRIEVPRRSQKIPRRPKSYHMDDFHNCRSQNIPFLVGKDTKFADESAPNLTLTNLT